MKIAKNLVEDDNLEVKIVNLCEKKIHEENDLLIDELLNTVLI